MASVEGKLSFVIAAACVALITIVTTRPDTPTTAEVALPLSSVTTEVSASDLEFEVQPLVDPGPQPTGQIDSVEVVNAQVVVTGWATDPASSGTAQLELSVDGEVAHRFRGTANGFTARAVIEPGDRTVCVNLISAATDTTSELSCHEVHRRRDIWATETIVAYYGNGATAALGIAGEGTATQAAERAKAEADRWSEELGINAVPAFDYIATVAQPAPGLDGNYSLPASREVAWEYLHAIREVGGYMILDFQSGRSDFLTDVKRFEEFLLEPDVGIALDPEWRMHGNEIPGQVIGQVSAAEINEVSEFLAELVRDNDLPTKIFMVHKFTNRMILNEASLASHDELAMVIHIDGFGHPVTKTSIYNKMHPPEPWRGGFKLFIDEDVRVMSPTEVFDRTDIVPVMITYQ